MCFRVGRDDSKEEEEAEEEEEEEKVDKQFHVPTGNPRTTSRSFSPKHIRYTA